MRVEERREGGQGDGRRRQERGRGDGRAFKGEE